jgi:hypothetical protein
MAVCSASRSTTNLTNSSIVSEGIVGADLAALELTDVGRDADAGQGVACKGGPVSRRHGRAL